MITGAIRSQVDQIWNAFWSGGVSNPLSVIEQITYLLFIKRLDEIHTREEAKANTLGIEMERRIFPEATFAYKVNDDPQDTETLERPYDDLRWQRLINFENREKMKLMDQHVFRERQVEGVKRTKAEGKYKGRVPTALRQADKVKTLAKAGVAREKNQEQLGISKASYYRCLQA